MAKGVIILFRGYGILSIIMREGGGGLTTSIIYHYLYVFLTSSIDVLSSSKDGEYRSMCLHAQLSATVRCSQLFGDDNIIWKSTSCEVLIYQEEEIIKMFYKDQDVICEIKMSKSNSMMITQKSQEKLG